MRSPANSGCVAPGWAATAARAVCKINEQALINKPEAGGNPHLKPGEAARAIGDGSAHRPCLWRGPAGKDAQHCHSTPNALKMQQNGNLN